MWISLHKMVVFSGSKTIQLIHETISRFHANVVPRSNGLYELLSNISNAN